MTEFSESNLLLVLHRWASQQDENFITDAFSHLLHRLLQLDQAVGIAIIRWLTDGKVVLTPHNVSAVAISTQVSTALGRPDIEIRGLDEFVYIEAKVESGLGEKQLHRYLAELDKSGASVKVLVLLSRYPIDVPVDVADRVLRKRWYQVADKIAAALSDGGITEVINVFLANQFVEFLRGRNITMERIAWELPNGVKALRSLIAMLDEAIAALKCSPAKSPGWDWVGYYLVEISDPGTKKKPFFVGIYYDHPDTISFETNEVAVVENAVEKAGCGKLVTDRHKPGGSKWVNELLLDSEEVHFFALSREKQMQAVERFLRTSLDAAARIRRDA